MKIQCLSFVLPVLLLACSGGGGGGNPAPTPVPPISGTAPRFTTQPSDVSVVDGQSVSFTVAVNGTPAPTITWEHSSNGTTWNALSGASGATYTFTAAMADDGTQFRAKATNSAGTATSNTAALTVTATAVAPSIASQPADQTVVAGQTATFTVVASGTAPLSYQWKKGATNVGTDSATLTLPNVQTSDAGDYTVTVTNSVDSVISGAATLTVTTTAVAPSITTQPADQSVVAGQTATFSVVASGTAPLSYQWKKGTTNVGTDSATLTLPNVQTSDAGDYTVTISNSAGNITSEAATLTVAAATVKPSILTHPASRTIVAGQTACFTVVASGTATLHYQWQYNGANVGTDAPALCLPAVRSTDVGDYSVIVSNDYGNVHSHAAALTVNTTQAQSILVLGGDSNDSILPGVERYDISSDAWQSVASMNFSREYGTATRLLDGRVLVTGGTTNYGTGVANIQSAEVYDPIQNQWTNVKDMSYKRSHHRATLMADGRVLVTGGNAVDTAAEVYDPISGQWSSTGQMFGGGSDHTATLLADGKVLVAGGYGSDIAEVYDPVTNAWAPTSNKLSDKRWFASAVILHDGRVLVAGGMDENNTTFNSADVYDPSTNRWSPTARNMSVGRYNSAAVILPNGNALIVGGGTAMDFSSELYDPDQDTWTFAGNTSLRRHSSLAMLLADGRVAVAGGMSDWGTVELYTLNSGWSAGTKNTSLLNHAYPMIVLLNQ